MLRGVPRWMKNALPALALLATSLGCRYQAASDACYAILETYGARLVECGYFATQAEAEAAIISAWEMAEGLPIQCDTSPVGVRDEAQLYDECIPALMRLDCATADVGPPRCDRQIVYRR